MTITWKQLAQAVLTGSNVSIYSPATATQATITAASAWNPSGSPITVDVFIGTSAVDGTHVARTVVPAGKTAPVFDLVNQKLANPQNIYASGNGATLTVSGAESV